MYNLYLYLKNDQWNEMDLWGKKGIKMSNFNGQSFKSGAINMLPLMFFYLLCWKRYQLQVEEYSTILLHSINALFVIQ